MEYDILNDNFTKRPWRYDEKDSYSFHRNLSKMLMQNMLKHKAELIHSKAMSEPIGKLFFTDFKWELNTPKREKNVIEMPKPQHVLETHSSEDTGMGIKIRAKHGFYQCKVKVKEGINIKKLIDYVDYKYYYEGYKDEDFVTITKIECV